jgi:hypothetical protein
MNPSLLGERIEGLHRHARRADGIHVSIQHQASAIAFACQGRYNVESVLTHFLFNYVKAARFPKPIGDEGCEFLLAWTIFDCRVNARDSDEAFEQIYR